MNSLNNMLHVFGVEKIGDITWAHAINSMKALEGALAKPTPNFIEVDISTSPAGIPIAAHPPKLESDLSFVELVKKIRVYDKGLKIDFKDEQCLVPCLDILQECPLTGPLILNADILSIKEALPPTIGAKFFINNCLQFIDSSFFSLGWKTNNNAETVYSEMDITEMLNTCSRLENVTFAVKAEMLPNSWQEVQRLLKNQNYSLSIWNPSPLSTQLSNWITENTDSSRCYYDIIMS